jgi:hypothetical protein
MPRIITKLLIGGDGSARLVLARDMHGYIIPVTFPNQDQAARKVQELTGQGIDCSMFGDRPYYVTFEHEPAFQTDSDR